MNAFMMYIYSQKKILQWKHVELQPFFISLLSLFDIIDIAKKMFYCFLFDNIDIAKCSTKKYRVIENTTLV